MANIAIIGVGWRADFFLKVAKELPDRFTVVGVAGRNPEKLDAFSRRWGVPAYESVDSLFSSEKPLYVVASVPWSASSGVLIDCARRGAPVLGETPPAPDLAALQALWSAAGRQGRIQIAEQLAFQPLHAARIAVAASGKIGAPTQAQVSVAHGYHGLSLIRRYLGIGFENATISGGRFNSPIMESPGRDGPPAGERVVDSVQDIAQIRFEDGKFAIYDFTGDQYFSYIRAPRLLVRGEKGEIDGDRVRYLQDRAHGIEAKFERVDTGHGGNLEGFYHRGYTLEGNWVYTNPAAPGRLSDDEIAVATAMEKMSAYANGGPEFYSLAEASQDMYLDLSLQECIKSDRPVETQSQPWSS